MRGTAYTVSLEGQRVRRALPLRATLLSGVALFALGTVLGARGQEAPAAPPTPAERPAPAPSAPVEPPAAAPEVPVPEVTISPPKPPPEPAPAKRAAPAPAAPPARVTRTPTTPPASVSTPSPPSTLEGKMQVMDDARENNLLPKIGVTKSTIDRKPSKHR